jgi:hypothetical protein
MSAIAKVGGNRGTPEVGVEAQDRGAMSLESHLFHCISHTPLGPFKTHQHLFLSVIENRECSHRHPDLNEGVPNS